MKMLFLFSAFFAANCAALANIDCSAQAESFLVNVGYTSPAHFVEMTSAGNLVYIVRANLQGGDSAYEVVVDQGCKYLSHRLLWAE